MVSTTQDIFYSFVNVVFGHTSIAVSPLVTVNV